MTATQEQQRRLAIDQRSWRALDDAPRMQAHAYANSNQVAIAATGEENAAREAASEIDGATSETRTHSSSALALRLLCFVLCF